MPWSQTPGKLAARGFQGALDFLAIEFENGVIVPVAWERYGLSATQFLLRVTDDDLLYELLAVSCSLVTTGLVSAAPMPYLSDLEHGG
jgi:hypothetical protein